MIDFGEFFVVIFTNIIGCDLFKTEKHKKLCKKCEVFVGFCHIYTEHNLK